MKTLLSQFIFLILLFPAASITATSEANRLYNKAEELFEKADYNQALKLYQKAVQLNPNYGEAIRGIGLVYEKFKKYNEALKHLNIAAGLLNDDRWIYCHIARNYYSVKNIYKTLESYDKAIEIFKKFNYKIPAWIFLNSAIYCYTELNPKDPNRAIKYAQEVINGDYEENHKKGAYESMAFAYFEMNDLVNALKYAKLRGYDFWMTKQLAPRKIVFNCIINLRDLMNTSFSYLRPGLIKIHMPMDTKYQTFISLHSSPNYVKIIKEGRENLAVFDFTNGYPEKLTMKITLKNIAVNREPQTLFPVTMRDDDIGKFADKTFIKALAGMKFDIDNPILINLVNSITKNDNSPKQKVLSLIKWIKENITHDSNIPEYANNPINFTKISEVLQARHGYCTQISALFIGMCRMINIPARMIQGWHLTPSHSVTKGEIGAHDCVEIYDTQNNEWIYVEPQGYSPLGINYWAHIVFYAEKLEPRDNFIDVMMIKSKSKLTYEIFQDF